MMNFRDLNYEQFEILVGRILQEEGYKIIKRPKPGERGPDLICISPDGTKTLVEVKHFIRRTRFPAQIFKRFIADLEKYKEFVDAKLSLLVFSSEVNPESLREASQIDNLMIWDNAMLSSLLTKYPKVEQEFQHLSIVQKLASIGLPEIETKETENELIEKLKIIQPGVNDWRAYEDICIEILTYAFTPPLSPPKVQSRSEDGLDRRDAIYAIRPGNQIWDALRTECRTRFLVAEFKNYQDEPGQKEVESLQQYLFPKAMRSFGILCSRKRPSEAALKARRRAWVESEKLIIFLSDQEMIDLINSKDSRNNPEEIIDAQLEEFFSTLCP